jgi:hypothetical protein
MMAPKKPRAKKDEYPLPAPVEPFIFVDKPKTKPAEEPTWGKGAAGVVLALGLMGGVGYVANERLVNYQERMQDAPAIVAVVDKPKQEPEDLVKIRDMRKFYLQADRADGKIVLRTGGNSTWRFNNPGRIAHSDFTRMMGAIGSDGVISVFPSYAKGREAMKAYLFTEAKEYQDKTMGETFIDSKLEKLLNATGVRSDTKISELTDNQKELLLTAIQEAEGWMEGKVTVFNDETDFKDNGW